MKEIQTKRTPRFRRWCRKGYAAFASLRRQVTIGVLSVSMSTILLSTTTPVQAQTVDSLTIARELEIETVEVTGVKATPTRSAMSSTSVFDRKAGASAPVQTLESVLRLSPAIDLRERSGRGTQADIMIRGGSFDQTMVMLNGINFTDARTGHHSAVSRCAGHCTVEDVGHFGFELNQQFTRVDIGGKPDFRPPVRGGRLFDNILLRTSSQRQDDECVV